MNNLSVKVSKGKTGFIAKLEAILCNQQLSEVVCWSCSGNSFLILNSAIFESEVLAAYFRHKRMTSFIRQLNMYGFHKQRSEKEALEFYHPFFQKERPDLHPLVERKKASVVSFKENQPEGNTKESQSEVFFSDKHVPSIKVIEPESEWNHQPSFRFNGSKMTIRLNEALTSLYDVEQDEEAIYLTQTEDAHHEPPLERADCEEKNEQIQNFFVHLSKRERQINLF